MQLVVDVGLVAGLLLPGAIGPAGRHGGPVDVGLVAGLLLPGAIGPAGATVGRSMWAWSPGCSCQARSDRRGATVGRSMWAWSPGCSCPRRDRTGRARHGWRRSVVGLVAGLLLPGAIGPAGRHGGPVDVGLVAGLLLPGAIGPAGRHGGPVDVAWSPGCSCQARSDRRGATGRGRAGSPVCPTKWPVRAAGDDAGMAGRERAVDRGALRAEHSIREFANEVREARLAAGLSQERVGHAVGLGHAHISRIERGRVVDLSLRQAGKLAGAVGLDLSVRTFPSGPPIRDAAQILLLKRAVERLGAGWRWRFEVPVAGGDDLRAWDASARHSETSHRFALDAETRIRDAQAVLRRTTLKRRDAGGVRVVLLVSESRHNRAAIHAAHELIAAEFPIPARRALAALERGDDPGGDTLIVL